MPKRKVAEMEVQEDQTVNEIPMESLRMNLANIKTREGVIGHIMRNTKSASIDLKDPSKIIDYAILSSSALETAEEISSVFDLGEIKSIVVEGKDVKVLSLMIGENKISVFMDKNLDHEKLQKELSLP